MQPCWAKETSFKPIKNLNNPKFRVVVCLNKLASGIATQKGQCKVLTSWQWKFICVLKTSLRKQKRNRDWKKENTKEKWGTVLEGKPCCDWGIYEHKQWCRRSRGGEWQWRTTEQITPCGLRRGALSRDALLYCVQVKRLSFHWSPSVSELDLFRSIRCQDNNIVSNASESKPRITLRQ